MSRLELRAFCFCVLVLCGMFVRWKRRQKAKTRPGRKLRRRSDAGDSLYCVVVESQRINGSPRQKVVCYLGSVDDAHRDKLWARVDFWDAAIPKLDRLPLTRREREQIFKAIDCVVARVPDDEATAFRKEREEYFQVLVRLWRLHEMLHELRLR